MLLISIKEPSKISLLEEAKGSYTITQLPGLAPNVLSRPWAAVWNNKSETNWRENIGFRALNAMYQLPRLEWNKNQ